MPPNIPLRRVTKTEILAAWKMPKLGSAKTEFFSKENALISMSTNRDSTGVKTGLLRLTQTQIYAAWKMPKLGLAKTDILLAKRRL